MKQKIGRVVVMLILIVGFAYSGAYAQTVETLSNNDIIKLTKLGLAPATIIRKIESSNSNFDVSVDGLVSLRNQGVDKEVIDEMVNIMSQPAGDAQGQYGQNGAGNQNRPASGSFQTQDNDAYQSWKNDGANQPGNGTPVARAAGDASQNKNDPKAWRTEGLYYYNPGDTGSSFSPLPADAISGTKTGGYGTRVAQYYSYGFVRNKQEAILDGAHSHMLVRNDEPAFYFYFNADNISPAQFVLVRLIQKPDYRVMVVGSSNYYERTTGIDQKQRVDFTYEKVADGIYKVYPTKSLKPGEYCFTYTGYARTQFSNVVYDFGIGRQ